MSNVAGFNFQRNGTRWDVVDWPEPGDWPGCVYHHHGGPWFADIRVRDGAWVSVEGAFDTRREAAQALIVAAEKRLRPEFIGGWQLIRGTWRRAFKQHFRQECFDGNLRSDPDGFMPMIDAPHNINWIAMGWTQAWMHGPSVEEAA